METMYDRIKRMTLGEMREFVYWVYKNGYDDGLENLCDNFRAECFFGGAMLVADSDEVMNKVCKLYE